MTSINQLYIASIGMLTPVGGDLEMTHASVEAGINRYVESNFLNKDAHPMKMALVPDDALIELTEPVSDDSITARQQRIMRLATVALRQLDFDINIPPPLFLAGHERLGDEESGFGNAFLDRLIAESNAPLDRENSRLLLTGRAGGIQAVELAFRFLDSTNRDYVVIGGVDSYFDSGLLAALDVEGRILADGIMDGFAPGEGACFILLSRNGGKGMASLARPGLFEEPGHRYSEEPYRGEGLSGAFKTAIKNAGAKEIVKIFSSLNGEGFASKEYGVALMRTQASFSPDFEIEHPVDCFGDLGAALAPVLLGLASMSCGVNLVYCSSDLAPRGAVCVAGV